MSALSRRLSPCLGPAGETEGSGGAGSLDPVSPGEREHRLILISVCNVDLAVPAMSVISVSGVDTPTPLPGSPPHILGLVATGELVLPLVDLQSLFGIPGGSPNDDAMFHRTLVVEAAGFEAGLVCHRARGLIAVTDAELSEPTILQGERLRPFLQAELEARGRITGVLDVESVLKAAAVS